MSVPPSDPPTLPCDIQEELTRLADSAGLPPMEVLRQALALFAHEMDDRRAAERMTPTLAELRTILSCKAPPFAWHDSDEPLFYP